MRKCINSHPMQYKNISVQFSSIYSKFQVLIEHSYTFWKSIWMMGELLILSCFYIYGLYFLIYSRTKARRTKRGVSQFHFFRSQETFTIDGTTREGRRAEKKAARRRKGNELSNHQLIDLRYLYIYLYFLYFWIYNKLCLIIVLLIP